MNNKTLGTLWEHKVCEYLARSGYWAHFIVPDARGAQPFDIVAVKDGEAFAIDCKTCVAKSFNISRLEDNQIMAFDRWLECGNDNAYIAVEHDGHLHWINYETLKERKSIKLTEDNMDERYVEE